MHSSCAVTSYRQPKPSSQQEVALICDPLPSEYVPHAQYTVAQDKVRQSRANRSQWIS